MERYIFTSRRYTRTTRNQESKKCTLSLEYKTYKTNNAPLGLLKKKAVQTKSKQYHDAYKKQRNELTKLIKKTTNILKINLTVVKEILKKCGKQ
jgi:hypothetical protein